MEQEASKAGERGAVAIPEPDRPLDQAPPWLMPAIRSTIWRIVFIGLGLALMIGALAKARGLVSTLILALFFSIAMDPAVSWLHRRLGWSRGKGAGAVFAILVVSVALLITVLIPALIHVAEQLSNRLPGWISEIERSFNISITSSSADIGPEVEKRVKEWLESNGGRVLGLASGTVGLLFQFFTAAMFTLYFAADAPKIRRALLVRLPAERQERVGWAWDTAIQQTGGYFYSRLLLLVINATLFFFVMLLLGVPVLVALPMSVFQGFFAEFIPVVGTYIGAGVPILVTLVLQGVWQAAALLVWTLVYQQIENYVLSPRLSARTMEINGGVAFGSALAGGAIAGPMGAFMAMPLAAMVTSFVKHYVPRYELAYRSAYDEDELPEQAEPAGKAEPAEPGDPAGTADPTGNPETTAPEPTVAQGPTGA